MFHPIRSTAAAVAALSLSVLAGAQTTCPVSGVAAQSYGQGCATVFTTVPTLSFALDATACQLDVTLQAFPGCCNTFLVNRLLVIGLASTNVPLPQVGSGCTLLASPDVLLLLPSQAGETFRIPLPPQLTVPFDLFFQGGAHYFTTIGFTNDISLTAGSRVTLS